MRGPDRKIGYCNDIGLQLIKDVSMTQLKCPYKVNSFLDKLKLINFKKYMPVNSTNKPKSTQTNDSESQQDQLI